MIRFPSRARQQAVLGVFRSLLALSDATILFSITMERAGRVLSKLKLASHGVTEEQLASAAWPVAVGKTIANRTSVIGLVRTRLVVQVEDNVWQRQLFTLRSQILRRLEESLGCKVVEELEFRISVPRGKPVQPAAARLPASAGETDEADDIRDPVFRSIYRAARRKASA